MACEWRGEGEGLISKHYTLTSVCRCCTITHLRATNQAVVSAYPGADTNLLFIHILVVALLHHLTLPALLLQRLLDELGHFTLFSWLLPPDHKPAF